MQINYSITTELTPTEHHHRITQAAKILQDDQDIPDSLKTLLKTLIECNLEYLRPYMNEE